MMYSDIPDLPGTTYSHQLTALIKSKCTPEEVLVVLRDVPNPLTEDDMDSEVTYNPLAIDVFVQTLLHLGAKSFSHSFAAVAKYVSGVSDSIISYTQAEYQGV